MLPIYKSYGCKISNFKSRISIFKYVKAVFDVCLGRKVNVIYRINTILYIKYCSL